MCRLRGHKADRAAARWNKGICFARCARCRRDLVRTAKCEWQVPHGYRIVWEAKPADEPQPARPDAGPEQEVAAPLQSAEPAVSVAQEEIADEVSSGWEMSPEEPDTAGAADPVPDPAPQITEWPLVTRPAAEQSEEAPADPVAEPFAVADEPSDHALMSSLPDFMDDEAGAGDWDDFTYAPRRSAQG